MPMKKSDIRIIIAVASVLIITAAGVLYVILSDEDDDSGDRGDCIEFFFYDNHENDDVAGLLAEGRYIAEGIWVKGYGEDKMKCFIDACKTLDIDAVLTDGIITEINGISDGNFHQMGWIYSYWSDTVTLTSDETYPVRFMAIGHGIAGTDSSPPYPPQSPDDIRWYYGESSAKGDGTAVEFYFYDNFENEPSDDAVSDIGRFLANGFWVTGYGNSVEDAFKNACSKMGKYLGYNNVTGEIFRLGDVNRNIHSLKWDGTAWVECNISGMSMENNICIAIGHGALSSGGSCPTPWQTPDDMKWSL